MNGDVVMTFNDMLIPAVGSASFDEEPIRLCDCIHFPTIAGMLWLKCPLRQHHLIYRMRPLAMKTCNVRCSALAMRMSLLNLRHNGWRGLKLSPQPNHVARARSNQTSSSRGHVCRGPLSRYLSLMQPTLFLISEDTAGGSRH